MKRKKLEKPTSEAGVFEILNWNEASQKWVPPLGNNRFRAFGYEPSPDGELKRIGRYFQNFAEAKVYALNHRRKKVKFILPALAAKAQGDGMLFGELVKKWEEIWLPNKNLSTQIRYRSYLKRFTLFWNMPVKQIEPSTIDRWIAHIKTPEYLATGHTTRLDYKHEFSVLRTILNFYSSRFDRNYRLPFLKDHKAMLKVREKMKISKDLKIEEFKSFMAALREVCTEYDCEVVYYLAFMQYATYTRVQEAAALHYEDFDFGRNRISVNKKIQWLRAKGYEDKLVDGSKANGGKVIPMPDLAGKIFREWTMKSGVRSGMLFMMNGELPTYRQIEYRYTQALKRAGLPFAATHLLRHASLTELYDTCKDLLLTAKFAGQRDIRSTMKYTKVRDEKVIETQKQMDEKLSRLMP